MIALLYFYLKEQIREYLYIILFVIGSGIFFFSTDYVFNHVLEPHQKIRIEVLLGMKDDPAGAGYNVNQSKIAIGSGGLFGKGFLNGTQTKLKYVPEQDTDFISVPSAKNRDLWDRPLSSPSSWHLFSASSYFPNGRKPVLEGYMATVC